MKVWLGLQQKNALRKKKTIFISLSQNKKKKITGIKQSVQYIICSKEGDQ